MVVTKSWKQLHMVIGKKKKKRKLNILQIYPNMKIFTSVLYVKFNASIFKR